MLLTLEFLSSKLCSSCHKLKSVGASFPEDTFPLHVNRLMSSHKCVFETCHHWSKSNFCCPYFPEFTTVGSQWNTVMVPCCPAYMEIIWWNVINHLCSVFMLVFCFWWWKWHASSCFVFLVPWQWMYIHDKMGILL